MKLREFFFGTPQEKHAEKLIKAREGKSKLSKKDQAGFDQAVGIVRGKAMRIYTTLGITLAGGGALAGVVSSQKEPEQSPNHGVSQIPESVPSRPQTVITGISTERKIEIVDQLIPKVVLGMENLDTLTQEARKKLDPQMAEEIKGPFVVMKMNAQNPDINMPKSNQERLARGEGGYATPNVYFFGYDVGVLPDRVAAGFAPLSRSLNISPDVDPNNMLDMLVVYHELRHANQDAVTRANMKSQSAYDEYARFYTRQPGEKARIVANEEATAYAYEIEMLDMILGGDLRKSVMTGTEIDIKEVGNKLKSRPDQSKMLEMLINFAKVYYPEGISNGNFSPRFLELIAELYTKEGYNVFIPTTTGKFQRYEMKGK